MYAKLERRQLCNLLDGAAVQFHKKVLELRQQNVGATRVDGIASLKAILADQTDISLPETILRDEDFKTYVYEAVCSKSEMTKTHVQNAYYFVWRRYNELVS